MVSLNSHLVIDRVVLSDLGSNASGYAWQYEWREGQSVIVCEGNLFTFPINQRHAYVFVSDIQQVEYVIHMYPLSLSLFLAKKIGAKVFIDDRLIDFWSTMRFFTKALMNNADCCKSGNRTWFHLSIV